MCLENNAATPIKSGGKHLKEVLKYVGCCHIVVDVVHCVLFVDAVD